MKFNKTETAKVKKLLLQWESEGKLSHDKVMELLNNVELSENKSTFDWRNLSLLAFFFAVMCIIMATALMISDDWLERLINTVFDVHDSLKSLFFFILAGTLYFLAKKRREAYPKKVFSNESLFLFGSVCVAFGITYLGFTLGMSDGYFPILILLASLIFGSVGLFWDTTVNWYLAIVALALWFGTATSYWSGSDDLFIGMNYPMRYVLFGLMLIGLSKVFQRFKWPSRFVSSTYFVGLVALFFSFWLLSVFGNYVDLGAWSEVSQYKFIIWAVVLAIISLIAIWYGLRFNEKVTRDVGIVFLLLNLYTRYFEYFWDSLHKVLFFIILAISFWLIGRKAENIWNLADKVEG
ncbi:hypothetical protein [Catalinimonas niigatensis]|uniref:hypothetical protein n=1 Tax=Catalinimonas niigatensis TaxID=1397264 RepID=UPI0026659A03|nr:hypothetical protein [Catalinimonas niigatensis]WPP50668.1 hypothetical protein PZB72_28815 [Catalinimonas niigatensis]